MFRGEAREFGALSPHWMKRCMQDSTLHAFESDNKLPMSQNVQELTLCPGLPDSVVISWNAAKWRSGTHKKYTSYAHFMQIGVLVSLD